MEKLFDETFACEDIACRNIWYGYIEFYRDGEYGKEIILDERLSNNICATVQGNLSEDMKPIPTQTNWYLYGKTTAEDAIGDHVRPTIMIREKAGSFSTHINISDHDFAVNLDAVLAFKSDLENRLAKR